MSKRAERRRRTAMKKRRAMRILTKNGFAPEQAVRLTEHLQSCSCHGCGNPRQGNSKNIWQGITPEELKAEQYLNEELNEI